ncbi:TetR/AcrR family transcriptional regulator [Halobacillus mangrovi]|uniref:TetR/AcrR family transcriptional regulator n=1 Tax=Halobacillus mangrovi TaxID=402384 RepID=UPI003D958EE4
MNGFEKRKERKKSNILNAAFDLFSQYGVQKVSIQEIAQKAQVSQVTIYNYFGGKDQLLFETVKKFVYEKFDYFKEIVHDEELNFKDKISTVIQGKKESALHISPDFIQAVMADQPHIKEFIRKFSEEDTVPLLMELIDQGKKQGYIHPELSFQTIMFYVEMYYQAMQSNIPMMKESPAEFSEEITHLFFYGLMGDQQKKIHDE